MKKLLFSKSHKKHYSDAVVRMGKNNLGFSLVELIIVIAIMAVLAAVAIPVFGMFIEKSRMANDRQAVSDVLYAVELGGQSMSYDIEVDQISSEGLKIPVGMILLTNEQVYIIGSSDDNATALDQMLKDSLGDDYKDKFVLKTEGWTSSYASFFSTASELLGEVDKMGTDMMDFMEDIGSFHSDVLKSGLYYNNDGSLSVKAFGNQVGQPKPIMSQHYSSSDEIVSKLAQVLKENTDREQFINEWTNLIDTEGNEAFAIGVKKATGFSTNREFYSAVRRAYNQCFANYVTSKGAGYTVEGETHADFSVHAGHIEIYGESAVELVGNLLGVNNLDKYGNPDEVDKKFPQTVCGATFDHAAGGKYGAFVDCKCCQALWTEYAGSEQAKADATAFYDTMITAASHEAYDEDGNGTVESGEGILTWAGNQADKFASMYEKVDAAAHGKKSVILITVYQDPTNGTLYSEYNVPGLYDE